MDSGLIQMTAHMVTRPEAARALTWGAVLVFTFGVAGLWLGMKRRWGLFFAAVAVTLVGLALVIYGYNQPRVKEIKCCAWGPISLEQVAAVYDIKDVDGKLLTLWER